MVTGRDDGCAFEPEPHTRTAENTKTNNERTEGIQNSPVKKIGAIKLAKFSIGARYAGRSARATSPTACLSCKRRRPENWPQQARGKIFGAMHFLIAWRRRTCILQKPARFPCPWKRCSRKGRMRRRA